MRLIGNMNRQIFGWAPFPLEICPGRELWEQHRHSEYTVFVDESFYRFFGFVDPDGNFCHAVLGVPTANYQRLHDILTPLREAYFRQAWRLYGEVPQEIKFSTLRTFPANFRVRFSRDLVRALRETGGFVSGCYTPTQGQVMERVRVNLLGEAEEVPEDHAGLYDAARAELLEQFQGVGQAELITGLLTLPFAAVVNFLESFECTFRLHYDPRQEAEDRAVRDAMAGYMDGLMRLPEPLGHGDIYRGMEIGIPSHDELGLQLVDVFAGEFRDFFRNNGEALTEGTTSMLITATSDEPLQQFQDVGDARFKSGTLTPMSAGLLRKLRRRNTMHILSYFYPVLAAGNVTCVTLNGQERLLEIPTGMIFDLLDWMTLHWHVSPRVNVAPSLEPVKGADCHRRNSDGVQIH